VEKVDIAVDQALLILLDRYRGDLDKFSQLKKLYLSGVTGQDSLNALKAFLESSELSVYQVCDSFETANKSATRRYFESNLALESLKQYKFSPELRLYSDLVSESASSSIDILLKRKTEYGDCAALLESTEALPHMSDETKDIAYEMLLLSASAVDICRTNCQVSLDIYNAEVLSVQQNSAAYKQKDQQLVRLLHGGNLLSHAPLPRDDELFLTDRVSDLDFTRATLSSTGVIGSFWVNKLTDSKVHPFVNSISGTVLAQIRIAIHSLTVDMFPFKEQKTFKEFFRAFISTLVYFLGGHSLYEFVYLFQRDDIKNSLGKYLNLGDINLESLFLQDNDMAFEKALDKTIQYNKQIIQRKTVRTQLFSRVQRQPPASEGMFSWGKGISENLSDCLTEVEKYLLTGMDMMRKLHYVDPEDFEKAKQEVRRLVKETDYSDIKPMDNNEAVPVIWPHILKTSVTSNPIVHRFLGISMLQAGPKFDMF
jgi:hypothetical protein